MTINTNTTDNFTWWKASLSNYSKQSYSDNKRKLRAYTDQFSDLYKNQLNNNIPGISNTELEVLKRQNGKCFYTGENLYDEKNNVYKGSIDHIYPASLGGIIVPENIVLTTREMNCLRGTLSAQEFIDIVFNKLHRGRKDKTPEELKSEIENLSKLFRLKFPYIYEVYKTLTLGESLMPELFMKAYPNLPIITNDNFGINKFHPDYNSWNEFTQKITKKYSSYYGLNKYMNTIGSLISSLFPNQSIDNISNLDFIEMYDLIIEQIISDIPETNKDATSVPMPIKCSLVSLKEFALKYGKEDLLLKLLYQYHKKVISGKKLKSYFKEYCFAGKNYSYSTLDGEVLILQAEKQKKLSQFDEDEIIELYQKLENFVNNETENISLLTFKKYISFLPDNIKSYDFLLDENRNLIKKLNISEELYQYYLTNYKDKVDKINKVESPSTTIKDEDILSMLKYKELPVSDYVNFLYNNIVKQY